MFFICTEFPSGSTRLLQQSEDKLNDLIKASESHAHPIDNRDSECTIDTDSDTDITEDMTEETSSSDMSSGDESNEAKYESHEKDEICLYFSENNFKINLHNLCSYLESNAALKHRFNKYFKKRFPARSVLSWVGMFRNMIYQWSKSR